jgi:hypothetical protein
MVDASDYDSDGTPDSSDTDDDNDGIIDSLDSCSQGTTDWTSTNITDRDSDGCKDRNSLISFEDTEDWSYQNFSFTILPGQEFEIWHQPDSFVKSETRIELTKPDGSQIFWGNYQYWNSFDNEYTWDNTFFEQTTTPGHLSRFEGVTSFGFTYGDPENIGNWSGVGTYWLNLTDIDNVDDSDSFDTDNGGVSIYVYLVGDGDAEDLDDDGDTKLDYIDACMIGEMNWTSNQSTDIDDDGCRDGTEDDDDDNDGWHNGNDECTNRVPTINESPGSVIYDLASNLSDSLGNAGDAIFYDFTGANVSGYDSEGYPIIDDNQSFGGDWGITPNFTVIENEPAIQFEGFNGLELPVSSNLGIDVSDSVRYDFQFYLNDTYFNNSHPTANMSSANYEGYSGNAMRTLISNQPNGVAERGLGFSMQVVHSADSITDFQSLENGRSAGNFKLKLVIAQPPDSHFISVELDSDLHFQEWHNVSIAFRFIGEPVVEIIVDSQLSTYDLGGVITDLDCWKSNLLETPLRIGAGYDNSSMWDNFAEDSTVSEGLCSMLSTTDTDDSYRVDPSVRCSSVIETYFSSIEIISPIPAGNPNVINSDLYTLKEYLYENISLSNEQKSSLTERFVKNWDGNWNATSNAVINYFNAYSEIYNTVFR